jgi:alpha-1,4-glucan branching enzyme GlgB, N-terminal domain
MSSLSPEAYAVIEGRHADPFRYLGPHVEGDVTLVRVFLPDAEGVAIVDEQGHERGLKRIHDIGLFEGRTSNGARRYRLRARYGERQIEIEEEPFFQDGSSWLGHFSSHLPCMNSVSSICLVTTAMSPFSSAVLSSSSAAFCHALRA